MQQIVQLTGIARLAAEGTVLEEKRRIEYRTLPTRRWLNRCNSQRVPFHWSINPYRGCEFGCRYCYARYTHEFMERGPEAFETEIYAKDWDRASFREELRAVKPGQIIGIGTATDPYQPAERRFGRTREVLRALSDVRGVSIFITTKSDLVPRDIDLLQELQRLNDVSVTVTVTTMDRDLARKTEPFAPRPDLRMGAVAALAEAGIPVGVIANPVMPLITDSEENLEGVARAARAAGARQFGANVLFLQATAQQIFFSFLAAEFPHLLGRYRKNFADGPYLRGAYPERIRELARKIRERVGIPTRDMERLTPPALEKQQLALFQ